MVKVDTKITCTGKNTSFASCAHKIRPCFTRSCPSKCFQSWLQMLRVTLTSWSFSFLHVSFCVHVLRSNSSTPDVSLKPRVSEVSELQAPLHNGAPYLPLSRTPFPAVSVDQSISNYSGRTQCLHHAPHRTETGCELNNTLCSTLQETQSLRCTPSRPTVRGTQITSSCLRHPPTGARPGCPTHLSLKTCRSSGTTHL